MIYFLFIFLSLLFFQQPLILPEKSSAVTYEFSGGRLGDNLLAYMHAKWISYIYDIKLLYKPFCYSNELILDDLEKIYSTETTIFKSQQIIKHDDYKNIRANSGILYTVPYFTESVYELSRFDWWPCFFPINWENKEFKKILKDYIAPKKKLNLIYSPEGYFSVALHVRKNSEGFDQLLSYEYDKSKTVPEGAWFIDQALPLKHSPDSLYIDLIKKMLELVTDHKLYIYIFTDDPNPVRLLNLYSQVINNTRVLFDCRKSENHHYLNVLEDLFSMTNFDGLIRSDSNFALVAEKIGDHKIVLSPVAGHWSGDQFILDKIKIKQVKAERKYGDIIIN